MKDEFAYKELIHQIMAFLFVQTSDSYEPKAKWF